MLRKPERRLYLGTNVDFERYSFDPIIPVTPRSAQECFAEKQAQKTCTKHRILSSSVPHPPPAFRPQAQGQSEQAERSEHDARSAASHR